MAIKRGTARGDIGEDNNIKVYFSKDKESAWVRVIAMHSRKKKGIGILLNTLFSERMKWGEIISFEEKKSSEISEFIGKVDCVPCTDEWTVQF